MDAARSHSVTKRAAYPAGIGEVTHESHLTYASRTCRFALESLESRPDLRCNGNLPQRHRFHSRTDPRLMGIPVV
jgi:hypothetical protein